MIDLKPLPHREAIAYFDSKGYAPQLQRFHHLDHWREEHARNWVVAKAMRDDVAQLLREEMRRALAEGRTLAQFQAELAPKLQAMGWWGRQPMTDPLTGEASEVQLGSMRRLKVIFDTNMRTAHAAGHWAAIQRTKGSFPWLHYIQIDRPTKRHDHARFHDKIWSVDDPIWLRIYPPNGWFCGCHVIQRTDGWMKRNSRVPDGPVDLDEAPWTHKRTGEVFMVPKGVNPGFDTNPGATWLDIGRRVEEVMPDLDAARRAVERGHLQGLRLRRLGLWRESLIIADASGDGIAMADATPDRPDFVSVDDLAAVGGLPAQAAILHSHLTETGLSREDIGLLQHPQIRSITAISPGGSIWRALVGREPLRNQIHEFAVNALRQPDLAQLSPEDRMQVSQHALGLFLEKRGVIHYHYSVTDRLRQLFARFADLIERLS